METMECIAFANHNYVFMPPTSTFYLPAQKKMGFKPLPPPFIGIVQTESFVMDRSCSRGDDSMDIDLPATTQLPRSDAPSSPPDRSPSFNSDSALAGERLRFASAPPAPAAAHLSSARAALNETRRMKKKRKSADNLTEIRKQEDRVTKKICNARTRRGSVPPDGDADILAAEAVTVAQEDAAAPPVMEPLLMPNRRLNESQTKAVHKNPHLSTNHDRIATVKAIKLEERLDVTQIDYRKRGFVARKTKLTESFTIG